MTKNSQLIVACEEDIRRCSVDEKNMRIIILLAFALLVNLSLQSQPRDSTGDTLYVWAVENLLVRNTPSSDGKVIGKLKLGDKVVLLQDNYSLNYGGINVPTLVDEVFYNGEYIHVSIDNQRGYVFSSFVSNKKSFLFEESVNYKGAEGLRSYIYRNYLVVDSTRETNDGFEVTEHIKYHADIESHSYWNKASSTTYLIKNWTVDEVLRLVLNPYRYSVGDSTVPLKITYQRDYIATLIGIDFGEIENRVTIVESGGIIIVTFFVSC